MYAWKQPAQTRDALALCLYQAGDRVRVVNPLRIKRYGESEVSRITTDTSDAALLARFCLTQHPDPWTPLPAERHEVRDLARSLQAVKQLSQQQVTRQQSGPLWRNRLSSTFSLTRV